MTVASVEIAVAFPVDAGLEAAILPDGGDSPSSSDVSPTSLDVSATDAAECPEHGAVSDGDRVIEELRRRGLHYSSAPEREDAAPVSVLGLDGTFFPTRYAGTPDLNAIESFETGLRAYLAADLGGSARAVRCLSRYARQYRILMRERRRVLTVYFLCDRPQAWQRREIRVESMSDCYFEIDFDPHTRRYVGGPD